MLATLFVRELYSHAGEGCRGWCEKNNGTAYGKAGSPCVRCGTYISTHSVSIYADLHTEMSHPCAYSGPYIELLHSRAMPPIVSPDCEVQFLTHPSCLLTRPGFPQVVRSKNDLHIRPAPWPLQDKMVPLSHSRLRFLTT